MDRQTKHAKTRGLSQATLKRFDAFIYIIIHQSFSELALESSFSADFISIDDILFYLPF